MKAYKIKNSFVLGLASWLNELNLAGKQSRDRTRFVKMLSNRFTEVQTYRKEIGAKYAGKDKKGNPNTQTVDNRIQFAVPKNKLKEFEKEMNELMEEQFVIDYSEANKEIINTMSDIVLNTDYVFGPVAGTSERERVAKIEQANEYEAWCKTFEDLHTSE